MANPIAGHPFPNLSDQPLSGLTFPWAEMGTFDLSCGPEGVALGMAIMVYWEDVVNPDPSENALCQLIGYSYRSPGTVRTIKDAAPAIPPTINRVLPWQHPRFNQMVVQKIARVDPLRMEGVSFPNIQDAASINPGPAGDYNVAVLTLQFGRPHYAIRTDLDVTINNVRQEWLRYTDRQWQLSSNMLTQEGNYWAFGQTPKASPSWPTDGKQFASPRGWILNHQHVTRRWYQIPEACLFYKAQADGGTPTGLPGNLIYTQTQTVNPITTKVYKAGSPIVGCVNSPIGGGTDDSNAANQIFGCNMGTLRFDSAQIVPQPLQLPASLMLIPAIAGNEALSQVQYDVLFNFDIFDPPRGYNSAGTQVPFHGHNLAPNPLDGMWYPIQSAGGPYLSSNGSGLQVSITAGVPGGAITAVTIFTAGTGYPASTTIVGQVVQANASGGTIYITTDNTGVPTSVAVWQSGGGYLTGICLVTTYGSPSTPYDYADFSDLFTSL